MSGGKTGEPVARKGNLSTALQKRELTIYVKINKQYKV
jgi:hypothetical protein